jgi:hypothetical protein
MKKIIILITLLVGLVATSCCNSGAYDTEACLKSVQDKYINAHVFNVPNEVYSFVVIDGPTVIWAETLSSSSSEVTKSTIIGTTEESIGSGEMDEIYNELY